MGLKQACDRSWLVAGLLAPVLVCCTLPNGDPATGRNSSDEQSIVGGNAESGWPGVGALVYEIPGSGYQGSFCTATLIAPRWALTAAHCLIEHEGMQLQPNWVLFFVGTNANPAGYGRPSGQFFRADLFRPHPQYNSANSENDVGLVHLAETATGVPNYPLSTSAMTGSSIGAHAFYVGYGATEGVTETGSGIKRSATIDVAYVDAMTYTSEYVATGICFGDSGGPGFLDGSIIGVNSTVSGSGSGDPCHGYYNDMRVDYFAPWINGIIGAAPPDCRQNAAMCYCAPACQGDGSCNNTVCQTKDCKQVYDCMVVCADNNGCSTDCYFQGTDDGKQKLDAMFACFTEQCPNLEGTAFDTCAQQHCQTQVDTCFPTPTGDQTCEQVYDCINACPDSDANCPYNCYGTGTRAAQQQFDALSSCFNETCPQTDATQWRACVKQNCGAVYNACLPPANCAITGGGCPSGQACHPTLVGAFDCGATAGIGRGARCATSSSALQCADGLVCMPAPLIGGACRPFCLGEQNCSATEYCEIPIYQDLPSVGACYPDAATDAGRTDVATGSDATTTTDSAVAVDAAGTDRAGRDAGSQLDVATSDGSVLTCDPRLGHYDCPEHDQGGCVPDDPLALNLGGVCRPGVTTGATLTTGQPCDQATGYRQCQSGLCEGSCLVVCSAGACPPGYRCDTSEIADPGVCRPQPEAVGCGCTTTDNSDLRGWTLLALLLSWRWRRR